MPVAKAPKKVQGVTTLQMYSAFEGDHLSVLANPADQHALSYRPGLYLERATSEKSAEPSMKGGCEAKLP